MTIRAVISDFGGVLTTPLQGSFMHFQEVAGIPLESLGQAISDLEARDGVHPLAELECGRMTEADFLERVGGRLETILGRAVHMREFTETYFSHLRTNDGSIAYMAGLRDRGLEWPAHQQRPRMGGALAGDAPGRRDLRDRRRLGVRRNAQARSADLSADL